MIQRRATTQEEEMKKLMLLAILSLSTSAFAQVCEVDLVDTFSNRILRTYRAFGDPETCIEGMKQCRKSIRLDYSSNRGLDCVRAGMTPSPIPNPVPNPYPYPTNQDHLRSLNINESVIYNNRYFTVAGVGYSGTYAIRSTDGWNSISNNIRRESLSVTSGCNLDLCTSESVINVSTGKYVQVIGLTYDDRFVVKSTDGWNSINSGVDRTQIAKTTGCINSRYTQLCVGNTVINQSNRYMTVVGIQINGAVVLKSTDGWNSISTNVNPDGLVVTR